jgi:hypothetical protein
MKNRIKMKWYTIYNRKQLISNVTDKLIWWAWTSSRKRNKPIKLHHFCSFGHVTQNDVFNLIKYYLNKFFLKKESIYLDCMLLITIKQNSLLSRIYGSASCRWPHHSAFPAYASVHLIGLNIFQRHAKTQLPSYLNSTLISYLHPLVNWW